jgi:hypothetical protein
MLVSKHLRLLKHLSDEKVIHNKTRDRSQKSPNETKAIRRIAAFPNSAKANKLKGHNFLTFDNPIMPKSNEII